MRNINLGSYLEQHLMSIGEYTEEFMNNFSDLDFELLTLDQKNELLQNTIRYSMAILTSFTKFIDLDTIIFKDLQVLNVSKRSEEDLKVWRSLSNRFSYLYQTKSTEFKTEFADFLSLDISEYNCDKSLASWRRISELRKNNAPRFILLIQLVKGLFSIPYSNGPIERAFSQLKIIKSKRRILLSDTNLSSLMILKNQLKRSSYQNSESLLNFKTLKRVKQNIDDNLEKKKQSIKVNLENSKIDVKKFILNKNA